MRKPRPNPRLVKMHRNYTVEEVARLFTIHKNTVRHWIKAGLPVMDGKRPLLILGIDLRTFLEAKRASKKQSCLPGELYCLRCRAPRHPAGNMAEFEQKTTAVGNLLAICSICESFMNQRVSIKKLGAFQSLLEVQFTQTSKHIVDTCIPSVNSDFNDEASGNAKAQP